MAPSELGESSDSNESLWWTTKPPYDPSPPLRASITADIAILGGGFTGVSSALQFKKRFPDKKIVLVEASHLGAGASGRNGGLMLNWVNGIHTDDVADAKRIFDATKLGIDLIEETIKEHNLDVSYRRDGCIEAFTDQGRADAAKKSAATLNAGGIPIRYVEGDDLAEYIQFEGVKGGIVDPTAGQIDGVDLLRSLRPVLQKLGVEIYENSPVVGVLEGEKIEVKTREGAILADTIILGTNGYTPELGYFSAGIVPLHSHLIATEPLSMDDWKEIGWGKIAGFSDDLDRLAYGCLTKTGRLVFGGGSNQAYSYVFGSRSRFGKSAEASFEAVHRTMLKYIPRASKVQITHRWTGTVALTLSRVCTMGVLGKHKNVYYALGYSGHGITLANLAGLVLSDIYAGTDERWQKLPFYGQRLLYVPPEPFRWLGYHMYSTLTGKSPKKSL